MIPPLLILIFFSFFKLLPYFMNPIPLGYDPGIYLYAFKKYSEVGFFSFTKLTDWMAAGLG